MRSIRARFNRFNVWPCSTYIAFARAIRGQKFLRDNLSRNFSKLVDKDDYDKEDKNILIDQLLLLSNSTEEHNLASKYGLKSLKKSISRE